ncbi:hypothetical protein Tco_1362210 [Tanacetum coccineum]
MAQGLRNPRAGPGYYYYLLLLINFCRGFVGYVGRIWILSPSEVQQMGKEGMQLLNINYYFDHYFEKKALVFFKVMMLLKEEPIHYLEDSMAKLEESRRKLVSLKMQKDKLPDVQPPAVKGSSGCKPVMYTTFLEDALLTCLLVNCLIRVLLLSLMIHMR